jgi:hypothetical protein
MTLVRAGLAEGFYFGEDAVLLALDTEGVNAFLAALIQGEREGASPLEVEGTTHQFFIEGDASDIEFHDEDDRVVWRLSGAKGQEVRELLADMSQHPGRGHHYVDISAPARTLVISLDEYV